MRTALLVCLAVAAAACGTSSQAAPAAGEIRLAPHRVVYELSLTSSRGEKGIETARGRIAYELTGNACEGYALRYRQVTVLQSSETGTKVSDLRTVNYESGDGRVFRFRNDLQLPGARTQVVDGLAERMAGIRTAVKLKIPKRETVGLGHNVVFPNAQMKDIIAAARAGQRTLALKVFDGSDNGRKIYETLAIIGAPIEAGSEGLEASAQQPALKDMTRWPVTLSYFEQGRGDLVPTYVLSFDLYDNGVSRALKLDYGDFALKGDMVRLDLLPDRGCQR